MRENVMNRIADKNDTGQTGLTLLEIAIAMAVFAVLAMGLFHTTTLSVQYRGAAWRRGIAMGALQELLSDVQVMSNGALRDVYDEYHNKTFTFTSKDYSLVNDLKIEVTCFNDEANVPTALGGRRDLDGDNIPKAGASSGGSVITKTTSLQLVPMQIELSWRDGPDPVADLNTYTYYYLAGSTTSALD